MPGQPLVVSLPDLQRVDLDVLVIGSGPAGVAIAERLSPRCTVGIVERGGTLLTTHVSNILRTDAESRKGSSSLLRKRASFIAANSEHPWEGDCGEHGILIFALGGRGIVAGAHLRRFDPTDFTCWPEAIWPLSPGELDPYYTEAELARHISSGECSGTAQMWVLGQLCQFNAAAPPWGVDVASNRNLTAGRGYDSSVARLCGLILDDQATARETGRARRLMVATNSYAVRLEQAQGKITSVLCRDLNTTDAAPVALRAPVIILAASPIESTRLVLNSKLGNEAAGLYLSEHVYCRGEIAIQPKVGSMYGEGVRVIVPPLGAALVDRFQIEVLGETDPADPSRLILRMTGMAAMDPRPDNKVTLGTPDEIGVPRAYTTIRFSGRDNARIANMKARMQDVATALGASVSSEDLEVMPFGRSHHEAGTLRMGHKPSRECATDPFGLVHGTENLYVADAATFPSVGIANPMLTIAALGYRLGDRLIERLGAR